MAAPVAPARAGARETFERIDELLEVTYRSADLGNLADPLAETVYILLSRQTQEAVYQALYAEIRARWPRWQDVMHAPRNELEAVLAPGGLQAQRAGQLHSLLSRIDEDNASRGCGRHADEQADLTLDYLHDMPDSEVEVYLRSLPGIGPKSARCVMSYSLNRSTFAVDTHVRRIFRQLGLVESAGIKADHDPFQTAVPTELRLPLHVNLVHHGRKVCRSANPACHECVLISWCDVGRQRAADAAPDSPVAIDLFSGAGGLSTGFQDEGFRVALAVEADRNAAQTYRANHPGVPVIEEDVRKLSADRVRAEAAGAVRVDAVLAGPPCQGYSMAGKREPGDQKNLFYREVTRIADELDAEFVVMENVLGARRVRDRGFVDSIIGSLRRRGYRADCHELNAIDFGVPQRRRRLVFMSRRSRYGAVAPQPPAPDATELDPQFLLRQLGELPQLGHGEEAEYRKFPDGFTLLNGSTMRHADRVIKKIARILPGQGPISYRRLPEDAARTLIAGHRALPVHPTLNRTISVREAARIQGFRDDFVFCGPRASQPLQVANAVPPPMAAAIARVIRRLWGGRAQAEDRRALSPA
jgi:DNA (cytosine-5)-methyltransferase 1